MIKENHKKTLGLEYYITDSIYYQKYGDIALLDNQEFIYHSYYSSRIKPDTSCPVPDGPETTYLSNRQPFNETINTIKLFLQSNNQLKDYF